MGDLIFFGALTCMVLIGFVSLAFRVFRGRDVSSSTKSISADSGVSIPDGGVRTFGQLDDVDEYTKLSCDPTRLPGHSHLFDRE